MIDAEKLELVGFIHEKSWLLPKHSVYSYMPGAQCRE